LLGSHVLIGYKLGMLEYFQFPLLGSLCC